MTEWHDFFVAEVGAAAALTGLVIVAISINLATILKTVLLTGRAAETVALLTGVLILSTFALVPQPLAAFGAETVAVALCVAGLTGFILYRARNIFHPDEARWLRVLCNAGAALPILTGGALLLSGDADGLYWLVPGIVVSLVGGIINSWILLVEILR